MKDENSYKERLTDKELLQKLDSGQVDYIAGGLAVTESRKQKYRIAPAYLWRNEVLVYRKGQKKPNSFKDVKEPILVPKDSSLAETLTAVQNDYPQLQWQESESEDADEVCFHVPCF